MLENLKAKFELGEWLVEPDIGRISNSNESRSLRPREMDMLLYLCRHANVVVTADEMIEQVWKGVFVTNGSVYFSLSQLRKTLGDDSKSPTYIETIPKRGYRLIADVKPVDSPAISSSDSQLPTDNPTLSLLDRFPSGGVVFAFVFLVIVGTGLVMGDFFRVEQDPAVGRIQEESSQFFQATNESPSTLDAKSVAVLPFVDLSPGNDQSYFSDGIAEELLFSLSRVKDLKVAARTSSFSFKGSDTSILEIGKTLNVAHILEGSVRTEGDTVRISAQLISTIDGFLVWSEVYERKLSSILEVQNDISRAIVSALQIEISGLDGGEASEILETDPQLYVKYLKGLDAYRTFSFDSLPRAEQLFTEVTEADPKYAKAFRMLGMTKAALHMTGARRDPEAYHVARKLTEHAIELDPVDAQSYAYLGALYCEMGKEDEGVMLLRKSLELSPSNSQSKIVLATVLARQGQRELARNLFRDAVEADPLNDVALMRFAQFNSQMGNSELALSGFRSARAANSSNPNYPHYIGRELVAQYGDLSSGAISYSLATSLDEKDHELAAFLALAYLWTEAPEMAKLPLQQAIQKDAKSALVVAAQSLMLLTGGETQQSLDLAISTLNDPIYYHSHGSKSMLMRIATSELLEQGRAEEAELLLLEHNPKLHGVLDGSKTWNWQDAYGMHDKSQPIYTLMIMADVYKTQGRYSESRSVLDMLGIAGHEAALEFRDQPRLSDYTISAEKFALQGDDDAALDNLSIAVQGGFRTNWQILIERNHAFMDLRDSPRFIALLQLIKTQAAQHRSILQRDLEQKRDQADATIARL